MNLIEMYRVRITLDLLPFFADHFSLPHVEVMYFLMSCDNQFSSTAYFFDSLNYLSFLGDASGVYGYPLL